MTNEVILVVEDNSLNAKLIFDVLTAKGYQVIESITAEDGLLLAEEHQPDLILMDIRLPGMDGITALGKLKLSESTRHIPVMAVTASVMPSERDELLSAGFDGFQPKPVNLKELLADMRTLINTAAGQVGG